MSVTAAFIMSTLVGSLCFFLGWLGRSWVTMPSFKITLRSHRKVNGEYEFTLNDGSVYRGDCTVWHSYPSGIRASTMKESKLSNMWKRVKWQEQED